jgi:3-hydroxybutyryl-CoA dehydrogenase
MIEKCNPVGVIGIGTMGRGIARLALLKGYSVLAIEIDSKIGQSSMDILEADLKRRVAKGKLVEAECASMLARIDLVDDFSDLEMCRCVVECVSEDFDTKMEVLRKIEGHLAKDKMISTNTSSLSVSELSEGLEFPDRFLGIHFFNPPEAMRLVEIVRGNRTSGDILDVARAFVESLGKEPVAAPDIPGFYVNRVLFPLLVEGIRTYELSKAPPEDIDTALKLGAGLPMGPLELSDMIGNDVVLSICRKLADRTGDSKFEPPRLLVSMVSEGKLGKKSGRGFYVY